MFAGVSNVVVIWVFVGLGVMVLLFLINGMARLYRKAGPHEALIVYWIGRNARGEGPRHGCSANGASLSGAVA